MMIQGLVSIIVGVLIVIFRKHIVQQRAAFNKFNFGTKYTKSDFKYGELIGVFVGALFIITGFLAILGIISL